MTKGIFTLAVFIVFAHGLANAQVPSSPPPSPSAIPSRSVRLSFVPPPMEGTISLGIYDDSGQLVRVLHQEAEFDEFTVGADALITKWDGKDNDGYDLPAGTYRGRGFLVAAMKIEEKSGTDSAAFADPTAPVRVKLTANPLDNNARSSIELAAGYDDENAYVKTRDGLPLITVAQTGDIQHVDAALAEGSDKSLSFFLRTPESTREFRITGIAKMMAFDCGEFELK